MNCLSCGTANPEDAKFCMNCGAALALACPNCHAQLPTQAKFCLKCGTAVSEAAARAEASMQTSQAQSHLDQLMPNELRAKIETARGSENLQGERRLVTAFFADIVGSTALAGDMDPEDYREIVAEAHRRVSQAIYRYEGTIAQLLGDGVLAFFGAPLAHEDDPERAVRAALDVQESVKSYASELKERGYDFDFAMRIGLNTGTVVVGNIGTDLHTEYLAVGDAVNLAARMEQTAEAGTIQISGNTHKFVAHIFEFEDLGKLQVKGKTEGVQAFRVLAARADPGRGRGIEGLDSPLVGREREMDVLREVVSDLLQGRGQIVSVMGEAGLGKSRLVTELRKSLAVGGLLGHDTVQGTDASVDVPETMIRWFEGRSHSYETGTPYAPFIDLLTDCLDLDSDLTDHEMLERIQAAVNRLSADRLSSSVPYLATLLGLSRVEAQYKDLRFLDPPQLRARIFRATADLLEAMAASAPLIIVLDDLHWADPTSLDLLEQIMSLTDRARLMILAIFRPRRGEPSWRFHERADRDFVHRYTTVELQPLSEDGSRQLVANLLQVEDLPATVRGLILAKAEGNPFYVEEVIRSLLDAGLIERQNGHWRATRSIDTITLPDTLVGVLTARLDRLDESARRVAQAASVIGRRFDYETLAAAHGNPDELGQALTALLRRELIRERSRLPHRVYEFKHALTQETAQASLLHRDSNRLHLRVAEYLEQSRAEQAGAIAWHYLEADEDTRALPYLLEAGDRAARSSSSAEAFDYYRKALEILDSVQDPALARRAYEGLASALTFAGKMPEAIETYQKMLQTGEEQSDAAMQVSGMNKLAMVTGIFMERYQEADAYLANAEKLAREEEYHAGLAELHMVKCGICTATGDLEGAIGHLEESVELGERLNADDPLLFGLTHSANTLLFLTRFDEAEEKAQQALHIAQDSGNLRFEAEIKTFALPWLQLRKGNMHAAQEIAEQGWALAQQIASPVSSWQGGFSLGQIARLKGEYERALDYHQACVELGKMLGPVYLHMLPLCMLGSIYLDISSKLLDQTTQHHTAVLGLMDGPSAMAWGAVAWNELGFCALELGAVKEASEYFERGLSGQSTMRHFLRPQLMVGAGFVALARGEIAEARKRIEQARALVENKAMKNDVPLIKFAEGRLASAEGDLDQALERFAQAEEAAAVMRMRPMVLRASSEAARILAEAGRPSEAEAKRHVAQATIDEIAASFSDEALGSAFVESAEKRLHAPDHTRHP